MYIDRNDFRVDIYPFADNAKDAAYGERITYLPHAAYVMWHLQDWTPQTFAAYIAKLQAAMDAAFEMFDKRPQI